MIKKGLVIMAIAIGFMGHQLSTIAGDTSHLETIILADNHATVSETASAPSESVEIEAESLDSGDTAWMIVATVLVIAMSIPGLALFYGGLVRAKNMLSVLMQVFVTVSLMSLLWATFGFARLP